MYNFRRTPYFLRLDKIESGEDARPQPRYEYSGRRYRVHAVARARHSSSSTFIACLLDMGFLGMGVLPLNHPSTRSICRHEPVGEILKSAIVSTLLPVGTLFPPGPDPTADIS